MEHVLQNVRVGLRGLRRTPVFAVTAILTLAVGIGLATAVFAVAEIGHADLSVGCSIVWQQFDHMFYQSNR